MRDPNRLLPPGLPDIHTSTVNDIDLNNTAYWSSLEHRGVH
jgi:hypothetical protein